MSKELEAWKDIKWSCYKEGKLDKQFDIIEKALKRLELYDKYICKETSESSESKLCLTKEEHDLLKEVLL